MPVETNVNIGVIAEAEFNVSQFYKNIVVSELAEITSLQF